MSDNQPAPNRVRRGAQVILGGLATGGLLGAVFAVSPADAAEAVTPLSVQQQFAASFAPGGIDLTSPHTNAIVVMGD